MNKGFTMIASVIAAIGIHSAASASPVGFEGEFFKRGEMTMFSSVDDAEAFINSVRPTATFTSTEVNYPRGTGRGAIVTPINMGGSTTTISQFLQDDGASLAGVDADLGRHVLRVSGYLDLAKGSHLFRVGSDDGFRLRINGETVIEHVLPRPFRYTAGRSNITDDNVFFELIQFQNAGSTGVEFFLNNESVTFADHGAAPPALVLTSTISPPSSSLRVSAVPLPATAPLLAGALLIAGAFARRRKQAIA